MCIELRRFKSKRSTDTQAVRARMETLVGREALEKIADCWVLVIGAGVGGTYLAYDLARKGYNLKICDPQVVETPNLGCQKYNRDDLGTNKAVSCCRHAVKRTSLPMEAVSIPCTFNRAVREGLDLSANLAVCFTDSFLSRFEVAEYFYDKLPVVFGGLSETGTWGWAFIQQPAKACLRCGLPHVDPAGAAGCTGIMVDSVKAVSSLITYGADTLILDHPYRGRNWNYRAVELSGYAPSSDQSQMVKRDPDCELCSQFG